MREDNATVKAREATAQHYVEKIMNSGWTVTHTDDDYAKWDLTLTNGNKIIYAETKIRDINPRNFNDAVIDASKVDFLSKLGNSAIIQLFRLTNEAYIWWTANKSNWVRDKGNYEVNNFNPDNKATKYVYHLPFSEGQRKEVDMTDYKEVFERYKNKYINIK